MGVQVPQWQKAGRAIVREAEERGESLVTTTLRLLPKIPKRREFMFCDLQEWFGLREKSASEEWGALARYLQWLGVTVKTGWAETSPKKSRGKGYARTWLVA